MFWSEQSIPINLALRKADPDHRPLNCDAADSGLRLLSVRNGLFLEVTPRIRKTSWARRRRARAG